MHLKCSSLISNSQYVTIDWGDDTDLRGYEVGFVYKSTGLLSGLGNVINIANLLKMLLNLLQLMKQEKRYKNHLKIFL